jgi:hypothetical protein
MLVGDKIQAKEGKGATQQMQLAGEFLGVYPSLSVPLKLKDKNNYLLIKCSCQVMLEA